MISHYKRSIVTKQERLNTKRIIKITEFMRVKFKQRKRFLVNICLAKKMQFYLIALRNNKCRPHTFSAD